MKNRSKVLLVFILVLISSCKIDGTFQGLYSYYNKTKNETPNLLIRLDDSVSICDIAYSDSLKIVITNGIELKNCVKLYENSIVYFWSPRCKSKLCYSLELLQNICNEKSIELFIVAEYYDGQFMKKYYNIKKPIFGIDTKYYKSNKTSKYISLFIYDLASKRDISQNFIFLEKGIFVKSFSDIKEL
ncbi:MAG: hypothetical protein K9H62_23055 [Bacteroidales bacterium]|nr:hypothetical protein [Bacteroidales bacterium]